MIESNKVIEKNFLIQTFKLNRLIPKHTFKDIDAKNNEGVSVFQLIG